MYPKPEVVGARLRELRGPRTQQEVANAVGVSKMSLSYYESGKQQPRDKIKYALAKYYGQSVERIFFT